MTALDSLMVLLWVGFVILGAVTGTIRQVLLFVAIYAATVLAGSAYSFLTDALQIIVSSAVNREALEGASLLALFILTTVLLYWGLGSVFVETRPAGQTARRVDKAGGGVLGLWNGLIFVVALFALLANVVQPHWPALELSRLEVLDQVHKSILQPALEAKLPLAYILLRPWLPQVLPGFPTS